MKIEVRGGLRGIIVPLMGLCLAGGRVSAQVLSVPDSLIVFNSSAGERLLLGSRSREDFWGLSTQFVTQVNQAYCGVASSVMVLNALGIPAPESQQYKPYRVFTQENFFDNEKARQVVGPEVVSRRGMTLDQLGGLLASYSVRVKVYHSADTSLDEFRRLTSQNLRESGNFVLVNFLRKEIGEEKGGHISPLAAYNEQTDRFLILDVSRYKYPPVWVKTADLWRGMATTDADAGKTRGFVFVSRN